MAGGKKKKGSKGKGGGKKKSPSAASTASSTPIEDELITPGALDLKLSQPDLAAVEEEGTASTASTPTASDITSPATTEGQAVESPVPDISEEVPKESQKIPIAEPEPESTTKGAIAAPAAEAPKEVPENPFGDGAFAAAPAPAPVRPEETAQKRQSYASAVEKPTVQEDIPTQAAKKPTHIVPPVPATEREAETAPQNAPIGGGVATTQFEVPARELASPPATAGKAEPQAVDTSAPPPEPAAAPAPAVDTTPYKKPEPAEPVIQTQAAPDSAPSGTFVSEDAVNQEPEESQHLWNGTEQGGPPRATNAQAEAASSAQNRPVTAAAPSSSTTQDRGTAERQAGGESKDIMSDMWTGLNSKPSEEPREPHASPTAAAQPVPAAPAPVPPEPVTPAAHSVFSPSPKSHIPADQPSPPALNLPPSAPLPHRPPSTRAHSPLELSALPSSDTVDGFVNPWSRTARLDAATPRADSPTLTDTTTPTGSNEPFLRPTTPPPPTRKIFANRRPPVDKRQLVAARPSVAGGAPAVGLAPHAAMLPGSPRPKAPPGHVVVEEPLDEVRLDEEAGRARVRDRDREHDRERGRTRFPSLMTPAPMHLRVRNRVRGVVGRVGGWRASTKIAIVVGVLVVVGLVVGLAVGLSARR